MKMYIHNIGGRSTGELDLPRVFKQINSSDAGLVSSLIDEIEYLRNDIFVIEKNAEISTASLAAVDNPDTYNHLLEIDYQHRVQIMRHQNQIKNLDSIIDSTIVP